MRWDNINRLGLDRMSGPESHFVWVNKELAWQVFFESWPVNTPVLSMAMIEQGHMHKKILNNLICVLIIYFRHGMSIYP